MVLNFCLFVVPIFTTFSRDDKTSQSNGKKPSPVSKEENVTKTENGRKNKNKTVQNV